MTKLLENEGEHGAWCGCHMVEWGLTRHLLKNRKQDIYRFWPQSAECSSYTCRARLTHHAHQQKEPLLLFYETRGSLLWRWLQPPALASPLSTTTSVAHGNLAVTTLAVKGQDGHLNSRLISSVGLLGRSAVPELMMQRRCADSYSPSLQTLLCVNTSPKKVCGGG